MTISSNTYYLDLKTWVNGSNCHEDHNQIYMLNGDGNSCCLGQFALQRSAHIRSRQDNDPIDIAEENGIYDLNFVEENTDPYQSHFESTKLAQDLITINDDKDRIADYARAELIKERMEKDGLKLIIRYSKYEGES